MVAYRDSCSRSSLGPWNVTNGFKVAAESWLSICERNQEKICTHVEPIMLQYSRPFKAMKSKSSFVLHIATYTNAPLKSSQTYNLCADYSSIFIVTTVVNVVSIMSALINGSLCSCALNIVQQDFFISMSKLATANCMACSKAQASAYNPDKRKYSEWNSS